MFDGITVVRIRNTDTLRQVISKVITWGGYGYDKVLYAGNDEILLTDAHGSYTEVLTKLYISDELDTTSILPDGSKMQVKEV